VKNLLEAMCRGKTASYLVESPLAISFKTAIRQLFISTYFKKQKDKTK
jgi:hypothetical protein